MGRSIYFKHEDDEFRDINPTCIWGLINGVGYRHWRYSMKRMLPYRGNHVKGHTIPSYDYEEHQHLLNEEDRHLPVDQSTKKGGSTKKKSIKARLKNLIAHHSTKERNGKHERKKYSPGYRLQRTYSIHHLELPDHDPAEKRNNWEHPIIFIPGKKEVETGKLQDPRKINAAEESDERFTKLKDRDSSNDKLDELTNVLEILQVDKRLFVEILQNANDGIRKSSSLPPSKAKAKLMKSGSFPPANFSHRRSLKPSKLKDKQSVLKWEKFPEVTASAENIRAVKLGRALSLVLEHTTGSDQEKHREEVQPSAIDEVSSLSALDERCGEIKVHGGGGESSRNSSEIDEDMLRKNAFAHRRSISLTESIDKYVVLFENNFGKEGKLPSSRSLRLRNEDEIKAYKNAPRLFSRIRSLSNLDLYSYFQYEETKFADTSTEEIASGTNEDSKGKVNALSFSEKIQEVIQADDIHDTGSEIDDLASSPAETFTGEYSARVEELTEDCTEPTVSERNISLEENTSTDKFQQSCMASASESSLEDGVAAIDDFQSVEDLENRCDIVDRESSFNHEKSLDNFLPLFPGSIGDTVNTDDLNILEISKSHTEDDPELDYIRHILEFSGFTREGPDWEWYSSDQPLKPSLFDEACRPHDLECFIEDLDSFYYYQLLFDLLNEELVHLLSRSFTYYPKQLSYSCRIRAFPVGNHMLEEISSDIGQLLNFKPGENPSIDSIIDFDLRKDESWMNLQYESESVALEVDHMIFEDLLKELVC